MDKRRLTQLGLYAQEYELATYQVTQYNDAINQLNSDYLSGKYSATEYADKLAELKDAQWNAVNAAEAAKDAIVDLNEARIDIAVDGIEKEIDKYEELIDAEKEALAAEKDSNDYKQSIRDKTQTVENLERQIAAMMGDTSAATIAKRKLLEEQLAEAKQDLADYEADHAYDQQVEALDKNLEAFENEKNAEIEALKATLENSEQLIAESFERVKANADIVGHVNAMTQALHDSLIQTLSGGYDISSISSSLNGITSGLNGVANAARDAASAIQSMGAAQASVGSSRSNSGSSSSSGSSGSSSNYAWAGGNNWVDLKTGKIYDDINKIPKHAKGTRSAKAGLAITDEEGLEAKFKKLSNGKFSLLGEGDQIFTKAQTDSLFEWSKFDPSDLFKNAYISSAQMPKPVGKQTSVEVKVDTLMNVEKVDSTNIRQMQDIANNAVDRFAAKIDKQFRYGGI